MLLIVDSKVFISSSRTCGQRQVPSCIKSWLLGRWINWFLTTLFEKCASRRVNRSGLFLYTSHCRTAVTCRCTTRRARYKRNNFAFSFACHVYLKPLFFQTTALPHQSMSRFFENCVCEKRFYFPLCGSIMLFSRMVQGQIQLNKCGEIALFESQMN
jgi:hypothetical protein